MKLYKLLPVFILFTQSVSAQLYLDTPSRIPQIASKFYAGLHPIVFNNKMAFIGFDNAEGAEWQIYDGNTITPFVINPGPDKVTITPKVRDGYRCVYNGVMYFPAVHPTKGNIPYMWDGVNQPQPIPGITPVTSYTTYPCNFIELGGKIYFIYPTNNSQYYDMFEYDPISNSTQNIHSGVSYHNPMIGIGTKIFYYGNSSKPSILDIQTKTVDNSLHHSFSNIDGQVKYGSKIYFYISGKEIVSYDGTQFAYPKTYPIASFNSLTNAEYYAKLLYPHDGKVYHFWQGALYYLDTLTQQISNVPNLGNLNSKNIGLFLISSNNHYFYTNHGMLNRFDGNKIDTLLPFSFRPRNVFEFKNEIYMVGVVDSLYEIFKFKDTLVPNNVSVQSIHAGMDLTLYPNPAKNELHLKYTLDQPMNITLNIVDINGRKQNEVEEKMYHQGSGTIDVNLKDLPPGTYFATVHNKEKLLGVYKFLKE